MKQPKQEIIRYTFTFPDHSEEVFELQLDSETLNFLVDSAAPLPEWTKLEFHQCSVCPLSPQTEPHCPLAARLVPLVRRFDGLLSFDEIHISVATEERRIIQKTTAQRAIGSFMGLVIATSGCPHTGYFKPMARFHLPLASREETVYRATSMYLLAQYFLKKEGHRPELDLVGLQKIYQNMQIINAAIVKRLRSATETDSSVNAIIVLDIFAKTLDIVLKGSLDKIRPLFDSFFDGKSGRRQDG